MQFRGLIVESATKPWPTKKGVVRQLDLAVAQQGVNDMAKAD